MTSRYASAALGAVCLAAMVLPAVGADVIYRGPGGLKDARGPIGVPVPAPVPIPEYKSGWYFRADIGIGILEEPDASERGLVYGLEDGAFFRALTGTTFGTDSFLNYSLHRNALFTAGLGLGYYFNSHIRGDLTVSYRGEAEIQGRGSYTYAEVDTLDALTGNNVFGTTSETIKLRGTVGLANVYYDFLSGSRFKPYIGAGIGFVWNEVSRSHRTDERSVDGGGNTVAQRSWSAADRTHKVFNLAAAAMVGFSYRLFDQVSLDLNYRYLYLGGPEVTENINGVASTLSLSEMHEHQIRAGFRYDID